MPLAIVKLLARERLSLRARICCCNVTNGMDSSSPHLHVGVDGPHSLLSHLGGPQTQRHLGIGRLLFSTAKEIGQGFALKQC